MNETRVGIRDLKARLSEYLRQVGQGQTVIITDRGRPIGRIVPVEQTLKEKVAMLQEAGMVAWNGRKLEPISAAAANRGDRQVSDILVEMRE